MNVSLASLSTYAVQQIFTEAYLLKRVHVHCDCPQKTLSQIIILHGLLWKIVMYLKVQLSEDVDNIGVMGIFICHIVSIFTRVTK